MTPRPDSQHALQPAWLLLPLGLLYLASLGRLVYLQAVLGPSSARSAWQRMFVMQPLPAPRGRILDREGRTLAEDTPVWRLILDAPPGRRRPPSPQAVEALAHLLGRDPVRTAKLWKSDHVYSVIAGGLSSETARRIRLLLAGLPGSGLKLEPSWRRSYPQGRSLAHLVGYLRTEAGGAERCGAYGLEKTCDCLLVGRDGLAARQRAGPGYGVDPALEKRAPQVPRDVRTTLDACIGLVVARELERVAREQEPEWATAVVLDPRNGELFAMASWPDFDPGDIAGSLAEVGSPAALTDRALSDPVEPGSTCKPFVIGRALAEGVLRPGEEIDAEQGSWNLGVRTIRDVHPGGLLDPREILVRSSNIAAAKVGLKMGAERLKRVFRDFRFAEPIAFFGTASASGILPPEREWRKRLWTLPSVSFGHQVALTPARLAWSFAALINGGLLHSP
ncbi:MAG: peptidoglycan D,D-transpeptidase FtsI family protein, partial [Planctomycetota bacterium]